jgi:hypothetical protein
VWVFGALRVEAGKSLTFTSRSRNSKGYLKLLRKIERAIPRGLICLIADNLKIHDRAPWGKRVARRASKDRARFHPQGSGVAQPHRGLVACIPATGVRRTVLRGQLRD